MHLSNLFDVLLADSPVFSLQYRIILSGAEENINADAFLEEIRGTILQLLWPAVTSKTGEKNTERNLD